MATKRGKSQARRNSGNSGGMPGWAWMVLGIVIAVGAITLGPKLLGRHGDDGFFRPKPDPNAQPAASRDDDNGVVAPDDDGAAPAAAAKAKADGASGDDGKDQDYSFYTVLPGQEVAMSDAQLAAAAKAEQDAQARALRAQQAAAQAGAAGSGDATATTTQPQPLPETAPSTATTVTTTTTAPKPPVATTTTGANANQTPYILQAGAFGGSGDAETVKAKIAMLGLNARVESAQIGGKTVYRVRMGPYATATELAAAKAKLSNGGLPAMAIKAK